jgi:eukaryotic-like serine/threonine-protein kinase
MNKFWAYLKTKDFRKTILLAIGSVIAIVLIAFFSLGFYTNHGAGIPVPPLKGLSADNAIKMLEDQGFDYRIDSVYKVDVAPGTIIEQDPDPGTLVKENRIIYLTMVSTQAPIVSLPDVEGNLFIEASGVLKNYGLKFDTTYRADIASNRVLEVRYEGRIIKPGEKIPKGSKLELILGDGKGAGEYEIPNLINQDLDAAKLAIMGAGFTIGTIEYLGAITDSNNVIVVSQYPMAADSAAKASIGTPFNLTVKQGAKTDGPN